MKATALVFLLLLGGCAGGVLDTYGPVAGGNRQIMLDSLAVMLAIVVPTLFAALAFAWWFRAGNERAKYRPHFTYSGRIELLVWSIPLMTILFLSGLIWVGSHQLDPALPLTSPFKPLELQVVSLDWKWLFIYPDQGIASVNAAAVPAGRPVHLRLTSASVMNAFFVPQLASMIYTMDGMATQLWLEADRPGDYGGRSTMFSGDGFSGMAFTMRALPVADFESWVARTRGQGPRLDRAAYDMLAQQTRDEPARTYGAVDPGLFEAIVSEAVPQAPGPQAGHAAPASTRESGGR